MTKSEYLSIVSNKLDKLPKCEYDKAMARFNKYFDDAGAENEQTVINDLGDPAAAGDRVIRNLAISNCECKSGDNSVKGSMHAIWVGILAVLACPIALPLAVAIVAVALAFIVAIGAIVLALGISGVAAVVAAPIVLIAASYIIFKSFPLFLTCFGLSLILFGLGGILIYGTYLLFKELLKGMLLLFGKIANKGGKGYEK